MVITNYEELLVLHKALMERHYVAGIFSEELIGSPVLAKLSHEIVDALVATDFALKGDDAKKSWEAWRNLTPDNTRVWLSCVQRLSEPRVLSFLKCAGDDDRSHYVNDVVSPFRLKSENMRQLLQDAGVV